MKAYIYDAIRTPRTVAKKHGGLHEVSPYELLAQLFTALQQRTGISSAVVEDVMLGCVSQVGEQGGNMAKVALLYAGWPEHIPGLTLNRFCSSSLDATCLAADRICAGSAKALLTGGVESMSRVPMLADKPAWMLDPVLSAKTRTIPLGNGADLLATLGGYKRSELDAFAVQSQQRAHAAIVAGRFEQSLISITNAAGESVSQDDAVRAAASIENLASLKPAFAALGAAGVDAALLKHYPELRDIEHQHTAGNSPAMVDGASLLLIGDASLCHSLKVPKRGQIVAYRSYCGPASEVLSGGIVATQKLLEQQGLSATDIDLVEYNESYAGPTLKFIDALGFDCDKVNVNGGAISLGHPMGATGAILIGMLLDELERRNKKLGLVAICGAAGSGTAMLIQRP